MNILRRDKSELKYLSNHLSALLAGLIIPVTLIGLAGCGLINKIAYEDDLLSSHNKLIELQKTLVQKSQQVLNSQHAVRDKYDRERFDLEKMDFVGIRAVLTRLEEDVFAMNQSLQEVESETARFAGYTNSLQSKEKASADEFVQNIKMSNKYSGMMIDDLRKVAESMNSAVDFFQKVQYEDGNRIIGQANEWVRQYDEHTSLQNEFANKATESGVKFMMAMGWKQQ